jgi:hypothetical protein
MGNNYSKLEIGLCIYMMLMDYYEGLLETLDILANTKLMKKIKQAELDIKRGKAKALSAIEKEMGIV